MARTSGGIRDLVTPPTKGLVEALKAGAGMPGCCNPAAKI